MDSIFEKLYQDFESQAFSMCHLYVNNTRGYKKWYKEHLHKLCLEYQVASQQKNATDIMCRCWADTCVQCPEYGTNGECLLRCR
jgi:hypothetical protein